MPTAGVVPVSRSQDAPGPMAMTVADAAALLDVLAGGPTAAPTTPRTRCRGGWPASASGSRGRPTGATRRTPTRPPSARSQLLAAEGATIVDGTDLTSMADFGFDDELLVLLAEFRSGLADYLGGRAGDVPRTLDEVVAFNRAHADRELLHFGQSLFEQALAGPGVGSAEYVEARARCLAAARDEGIDAVLRAHELDALVTPSYAPACPIDLVNAEAHPGACTQPTAIAGYPLVTVPTELAAGLPVAVSFWGTAGSEATLIEIAHGYEVARDRTSGPLPAPTYPNFV